MTGTQEFEPVLGRRTVVTAVGAAGLAAALSACAGESEDTSAGSVAVNSPSNGAAGGGTQLTTTAEIPEGGGVVFADQGVVVTQPTAGDFKAFSSTCTHQGCAVKSVSNGSINCPCHNSVFSATDGSVQSGPAMSPLPAVNVRVQGDAIMLA
jgi:Rieske Fe-S protein